jgi:poly(ADP-ribose) glycohydrolase ARH3
MVGCAVGDALGAGCGVFCGRWTDDTHMMIGVAESLISSKGFDGNHMAQTFVKKLQVGALAGLCSRSASVFRWIKAGVPWNEASKRLFGEQALMETGRLYTVSYETTKASKRRLPMP